MARVERIAQASVLSGDDALAAVCGAPFEWRFSIPSQRSKRSGRAPTRTRGRGLLWAACGGGDMIERLESRW
jgi:hypothetical protein